METNYGDDASLASNEETDPMDHNGCHQQNEEHNDTDEEEGNSLMESAGDMQVMDQVDEEDSFDGEHRKLSVDGKNPASEETDGLEAGINARHNQRENCHSDADDHHYDDVHKYDDEDTRHDDDSRHDEDTRHDEDSRYDGDNSIHPFDDEVDYDDSHHKETSESPMKSRDDFSREFVDELPPTEKKESPLDKEDDCLLGDEDKSNLEDANKNKPEENEVENKQIMDSDEPQLDGHTDHAADGSTEGGVAANSGDDLELLGKRNEDLLAPTSSSNFEDEINFMVDDDDNMLDEEMIYEDGTTIRHGQDDGVTGDLKDSSSSGQLSSKKTRSSSDNNKGNSCSGGAGGDAAESNAEGREGGGGTSSHAQSSAAGGGSTEDPSSNKDTSANMESSEKKSTSESGNADHSKDSKGGQKSGCNLWVSGLASSTRAQEVKSHFSKHGKVISAKIVMSAKSPGSKCYGFVTMNSPEEASACIKNLNKTELRGRIIQVERAKGEPSERNTSMDRHRSNEPRDRQRSTSSSHDPHKRRTSLDRSREHSRSRPGRPRVVDHRYGPPRPIRALGPRFGNEGGFREAGPRANLSRRLSSRLSPSALDKLSPRHMEKQQLGISQIVEECERQRSRVRERLIREDERRAREDETRQRLIERRQRAEAERLAREREQLRAERERIERQKQELLRLEREQQRLEREKLEREREELRRQQLKLVHGASSRMETKPMLGRFDDRRALKRPAEDRRDHYEDRKRPAPNRIGDSRPRYAGPPQQPLTSRRYDAGHRSEGHRYEANNNYGGRGEGAVGGGRFERHPSSGGGAAAGGRFERHPPSGAPGAATEGRFERHPNGGSAAGGAVTKTSSEHLRWMPSGGAASAPAPARRSDAYFEERRGSNAAESRSSRSNYNVSYIAPPLPPPAPTLSRAGDNRIPRDGGKGSYGGSSNSSGGTDVWRTGSSKSSYSGSSKAYPPPNGSSSGGALLSAPHDGSTWRGSVSSSSSSRWPSDGRGSSSSGGNTSVGGATAYSGGLPSSVPSHHSSGQSISAQEGRGSYGVPAASFNRKFLKPQL
ncbi:scaffold attachment factor B2 [Hyalella azteca]|uniref:Scaffold attachment factor B2 n=1 Tax=Hyalella azteca TaxID=294128 RepID=A0A8B7PB80_HYAAZ|nr:scaffold attachment factor B2 [Hyalella azteca]